MNTDFIFNSIILTNTSDAILNSSGSLILYGGASISKNLVVGGNLSVQNFTISNFGMTNIITSNITTANIITTDLVSTNSSLQNLSITNSTTINSRISNLISTNSTVSNLISNNSSFSNLISNNSTLSNLLSTNSTFTNLLSTNSTFTNSRISNILANTSTITNLIATNSTISNTRFINTINTNHTCENFIARYLLLNSTTSPNVLEIKNTINNTIFNISNSGDAFNNNFLLHGRDTYFTDSTSANSTTSLTLAPKCSITTGNLSGGLYVIKSNWSSLSSANNRTWIVNLTLDNNILIEHKASTANAGNDAPAENLIFITTISPGVHVISLNYGVIQGQTYTISNARLLMYKIS